ncbi:MAG: hypothetical protein JO062_07345 [Bryobacterales bacterium]|nr:hypothetical protein [Bryobacterales bacterium]
MSAGLALTAVFATIAAVSHERAWNSKTILWLGAAAVILCGMAWTTYYYHLHENDDQDEGDNAPDPVAWIAPPWIASEPFPAVG